jgi:hypothetical protein
MKVNSLIFGSSNRNFKISWRIAECEQYENEISARTSRGKFFFVFQGFMNEIDDDRSQD